MLWKASVQYFLSMITFFSPFLQYSFFLSLPFTWVLKQKAWWALVQDRHNDSAALDFNFDWFEDVWWKEVSAIIFIAFLLPKLLEDQALPKRLSLEMCSKPFNDRSLWKLKSVISLLLWFNWNFRGDLLVNYFQSRNVSWKEFFQNLILKIFENKLRKTDWKISMNDQTWKYTISSKYKTRINWWECSNKKLGKSQKTLQVTIWNCF